MGVLLACSGYQYVWPEVLREIMKLAKVSFMQENLMRVWEFVNAGLLNISTIVNLRPTVIGKGGPWGACDLVFARFGRKW